MAFEYTVRNPSTTHPNLFICHHIKSDRKLDENEKPILIDLLAGFPHSNEFWAEKFKRINFDDYPPALLTLAANATDDNTPVICIANKCNNAAAFHKLLELGARLPENQLVNKSVIDGKLATHLTNMPCAYDNTMFLDQFNDINVLNLCLAPKNSGKSSNARMLKLFFSRSSKEGSTIEWLGSDISNTETFFEKQGKYSVIYLDFSDYQQGSHESFLIYIFNKIAHLYQEHSYLLNSGAMTERSRKRFTQFSSVEHLKTCDKFELQHCLSFLLDFLYRDNEFNHIPWKYQRPIVIINGIDKFYAAVNLAADEVMRNIITTVLSNHERIHKAIYLGTSEMACKKVLGRDYPIWEHQNKYSPYFLKKTDDSTCKEKERVTPISVFTSPTKPSGHNTVDLLTYSRR